MLPFHLALPASSRERPEWPVCGNRLHVCSECQARLPAEARDNGSQPPLWRSPGDGDWVWGRTVGLSGPRVPHSLFLTQGSNLQLEFVRKQSCDLALLKYISTSRFS